SEGVYGFQMVVENGSGVGGTPPSAGNAPEIWVAVDLSKPTGRILGVDNGANPDELVVRWEASDDVPDARPISLSYATSLRGPLTRIAAGLENTGNYLWRLERGVPQRLFLRLEVRDEAGNLSVFETPEAIGIDRQRPQGHIRGIRPLN